MEADLEMDQHPQLHPEPDPPPNDLPVELPDGFVATKLITAYKKNDLKLLARHFGLSDEGIVVILKARLKAYLNANADHFVPIPAFRPFFTDDIRRQHLPPEPSPSPPPQTPPPAGAGRRRNPRRGFLDIPPGPGGDPPNRDGSVAGRQNNRQRSASPRRNRERRQAAPRSPSPIQQLPAFRAGHNDVFDEVPDSELSYIFIHPPLHMRATALDYIHTSCGAPYTPMSSYIRHYAPSTPLTVFTYIHGLSPLHQIARELYTRVDNRAPGTYIETRRTERCHTFPPTYSTLTSWING